MISLHPGEHIPADMRHPENTSQLHANNNAASPTRVS
jgi:hypothetical protein